MVALDVQTLLAVAVWAPHTREEAPSSKPLFPQLQKVGLGLEMHALDSPEMGRGWAEARGIMSSRSASAI